ncbi:MAG TPA: hypothetical protein VM778_06165 [Gemmatimonadota bacterium]|nr:hypothetical protein [Gemmatimonadota bacterium]
MLRTLAPLALVALVACSHTGPPSAPSPGVVTATLDREFDLAVGGTAEVGDGGLTIAFTTVREDSRCPSDAICVWSGDAAALLSAAVGRASAETLTLHTHLVPRSAPHGGYTIHLISLSPYPDSRDPIEPGEYVARLRVELAPAAPGD